jgi:mono/diheme cytochrome c family protein
MKRLLRWTGLGLGGLVGVMVVALLLVYGVTQYRITRTYQVNPAAVALRSDPATLAWGKHVATVRGCTDCHTPSFGGKMFIDEPVIARLFAANLTAGRGGIGAVYRDQDWVRSIREGVRPDGKPLLFMPAHEFNVIGDRDLGALIAYLKSLPPVDNQPVKNRVGPIGRILFLKGDLPLVPAELIDHDAPRPATPDPAPTARYGKYLASGCTGCHGAGFSGGPIPGTPPGFPIPQNITPDTVTGIGKWSEGDFVRTIRTGKRPDGTGLKPEMPWRAFSEMSDDELHAIWLYLRTVPAKAGGNR